MDSLLSCLIESNSSEEGFNVPLPLQRFIRGVNDAHQYPFIRKKYRGKNGKISIHETHQSLMAGKKNKATTATYGFATIIEKRPNQETRCFGEMLPTIPTQEDIIAELSRSEFEFIAPTT